MQQTEMAEKEADAVDWSADVPMIPGGSAIPTTVKILTNSVANEQGYPIDLEGKPFPPVIPAGHHAGKEVQQQSR